MSFTLNYTGDEINAALARATAGGEIDQSITDAIDAEEVRAEGVYMKKGVDYVTAGQKSGTTLGTKATAEGNNTTASGAASHAGGFSTTASGAYSYAGGYASQASGQSSHAQGLYTVANHRAQTVLGEYNVADPSTAAATARGTYAEIVGNGTANNDRSNARTLDWDGNEVLAGKLTIGSDPVDDMDVVPKKMLDAVAITDTASGSIASFSDGADGIPMRSVKAQIEPVQDLHGYDAPWPEGGRKNKLPLTVEGIKAANSSRTWSGNATTFNGITFTILTNESGAVTGIQANGTATAHAPLFLWIPSVESFKSKFSEASVRFNGGVAGGSATTYYMRIAQLSPYANIATVTGASDVVVNLSSISDSAGGVQVLVNVDNGTTVNNIVFKPMIRLASVTDATFAPYSNECPISGWTGAEVTRTGKNLYNKNGTGDGYVAGNALLVDNTLDTNQYFNVSEYIKIKPNTAYTLQSLTGNAAALCFYDANKGYISGSIYGGATTKTITSPATAAYIRFSAPVANADTIQLEEGSSATAYEAFGTVYPVTWQSQAGTVYGGSIDPVSGELTVDWKSVDLGTYDWGKTAGNFFYWSNKLQDFYRSDVVISGRIFGIGLCSQYQFVQDIVDDHNSSINLYYDAGFGQTRVFIHDDTKASMTIAEFKTAVTGIKLFYKTTDVQTYQLSPQQITSLLGQNNVWSNTGDVEVTYVADPKLYIAKMLGGGTLTLGSVSPLSVNRPAAISEEDLEQAGEVSEAVEEAAETVLPAESGETEEEA